ncbi:MAG TPA: TIGR03862 family flavoprotein [Crocinitomix sp.]|nr:TIGR03862 family flavoprotein [Crocinitomix sp.]
MTTKKQNIAIIGGGSSALFFASKINTSKYNVNLYEQNSTLGRKFLVAGKGGFNLTHSEDIKLIISRYTPQQFLTKALSRYSNEYLINWFKSIGINMFIGSSKRVYPSAGTKPIQVLKAIENLINSNHVKLNFNHKWIGWKNNQLIFENLKCVKADIVVFSMGGGSWSVTGSNRNWLKIFKEKGIETIPFYPSNCAYNIIWDTSFIEVFEGEPLKNIAIKCKDQIQKGEIVLTKFGIEGNAIYALSPQIRKELNLHQSSEISIDFKPMLTLQNLLDKYINSNQKSITQILLRDLKLSRPQIGLLKTFLSKDKFTNPKCLVNAIKSFKLTIVGVSPLDKAISTVGGVTLHSVDENFQLKQLPNHYCIGEMLDWDAPTGGYLLQACYSMGNYLAEYLNQK